MMLIVRQTEGYFHKYSQFAAVSNVPSKPTEDEKETEATIQDLLEKVRKIYIRKDCTVAVYQC